jgi:hypothetical protein
LNWILGRRDGKGREKEGERGPPHGPHQKGTMRGRTESCKGRELKGKRRCAYLPRQRRRWSSVSESDGERKDHSPFHLFQRKIPIRGGCFCFFPHTSRKIFQHLLAAPPFCSYYCSSMHGIPKDLPTPTLWPTCRRFVLFIHIAFASLSFIGAGSVFC